MIECSVERTYVPVYLLERTSMNFILCSHEMHIISALFRSYGVLQVWKQQATYKAHAITPRTAQRLELTESRGAIVLAAHATDAFTHTHKLIKTINRILVEHSYNVCLRPVANIIHIIGSCYWGSCFRRTRKL